MKNKKDTFNIIISFVIVFCIIGLAIYSAYNKPERLNNQQNSIDLNNNINQQQIINNNIEEELNSLKNKMDIEKNIKSLSNFIPVSKVDTLEKIDIVVGDGQEVKEGDIVSVHYTGAIASNGEIFQSSKDFGVNPVTFPLDGVIKGWTDGIPGMKVGGTRRLVIPAEQAYGSTPPPGSGIPVNAALVFDVELIDIK